MAAIYQTIGRLFVPATWTTYIHDGEYQWFLYLGATNIT